MRTIIIYFLLCLVTLSTKAQDVDEKLAIKVAENFFNSTYKAGYKVNGTLKAALIKEKKTKNTYTKKFRGHDSYYAINMEGGGWVIVSASKALGPVLVNTPEGEFNIDDTIPAFNSWMKQYEVLIDSSLRYKVQKKEKEKKWKDYEDGIISKSNSSNLKSTHNPDGSFWLLDTRWGQTGSNDEYPPNSGPAAYNTWMPENCNTNSGGRASAGCIAVAVAQIMNYWKFATGDYADFDWWNMAPDLISYNTNYETEKSAISYLLKRVGDRSEMEYGCSSSSDAQKAMSALMNFGYLPPPFMMYKECDWYTTYSSWIDDLKDQVNAGLPVLYIYWDWWSEIGHAFVCDGLQGEHSFHFNLGWNGQWDTFYDCEDLKKDDKFDYSNMNNHQCVLNIIPLLASSINLENISISTSSSDPWPNKKTWEAENITAAGNNTYFEVNSNADCHLIGTQSITLLAGFHIKPGGTFLAKPVLLPTLMSSRALNEPIIANLGKTNISSKKSDESDNYFRIFPNPTTNGILYISSRNSINDAVLLDVYDVAGHKVLNTRYNSFYKEQLNLQYLSEGIYFIKIISNMKVFSTKIIKNK